MGLSVGGSLSENSMRAFRGFCLGGGGGGGEKGGSLLENSARASFSGLSVGFFLS